MLRIVHVISDLDTGGAEVMLEKLVMAMDRSRFSNTVVSLTDGGQLAERIMSSGITVHQLGMTRGRPHVAALPRLIRLFRSSKPHIVQSWLYHADLLSTLAVKLSGSRTLIWNLRCSDMDLTQYSPLTRRVQRVLAWWSASPNAVVVNSESGKRQHERLGYHPWRWEVIPNGFDIHRFRPDANIRLSRRKEWRVADDTVLVALIARVDPMKDHATFLHAAQQVADERKDVQFLLVGKGTEALAPAIDGKGLSRRMRVFGYRNNVESLLPAVDLVCLSSAFGEGFPNVLGEAMACGIPCVSTDVGDARLIIGDTGVVVPIRDSRALARALVDLIDCGPAARAVLGQAARARIETTYTLPRIVERYERLYSEVSGSVQ